jgi:phosphoribosylformylglycinamidine (FGAM) synthase PurS component
VTDQAPTVRRIEVHPKSGAYDPLASSLVADARELAISIDKARSARVYLIQGDLNDADTTLAIRELTGRDVEVRTGRRYDLAGVDESEARTVAERLLANAVVERIHTEPYLPDSFLAGTAQEPTVTHVPITTRSDDELAKLSRDAHLFLDLDEMRAIRGEFRELGREPTDIELETLAQTWSEHCVHKTLKSTISYRGTIWRTTPSTGPTPSRGIDVLNPDGSVTDQQPAQVHRRRRDLRTHRRRRRLDACPSSSTTRA